MEKIKQKMKILIKFLLIFYMCIFMLNSCWDCAHPPSDYSYRRPYYYYYFIFPKESKEYKKFKEAYGFLLFNSTYEKRFYIFDETSIKIDSKIDFKYNGVIQNLISAEQENFAPSWIEYDSIEYNDFLRIRIDQGLIQDKLNLSDKNINFILYVKISDLIDTFNVFNARRMVDSDTFIVHDNISINGKKLYFLDLYKFGKIEEKKAVEYYYNKFKISSYLTWIDSYRNPNYLVLDENEDININGN